MSRGEQLLREVRQCQTGSSASLQVVREMHLADGPSLSLGGQLHRKVQSQVFLSLPPLCHCNPPYIQIALTIVSFTLIADYISAEKPILTHI